MGTQRHKLIKACGEAFKGLSRKTGDQVRVDVNAGFFSEKAKVIVELGVILLPADALCGFRIERLNAHFELQSTRRKLCNDLPQRCWQVVGHHLKVHKQSGPQPVQKELENGPAHRRIQIKGAIHKLKLQQSPVEQSL